MAGENFDAQLIDRIVREVMRRLTEGEVPGDASSTDVVVNENVVSLATLEGRLSGVQRVVVGQRAVVTPAVRDELNDRGVELLRR